MNDWSQNINKEQTDNLDAPEVTTTDQSGATESEGLEDITQRLQAEVEELRERAAAAEAEVQYARADLDNYRKRRNAEAANEVRRAREAVLQRFLSVLDDFDRALDDAPTDVQSQGWFEGFRLIERKFWSILESEGVEAMDSVGQPFDPSFHEAVQVDPESEARDTVVEEYQRGYFINGNVLRPAMVKVGSSPDAGTDTK